MSQRRLQAPLTLLIALCTLIATLWRFIPVNGLHYANLLDWPFFMSVLCSGWYLAASLLLLLKRRVPQEGYLTAAALCVVPLYEAILDQLPEQTLFAVAVCVAALLAAGHFIIFCDVKAMRRSHVLYALIPPGAYGLMLLTVMLAELSTLTDDAEGTSIIALLLCMWLLAVLLLLTLAAALLLCALNRLIRRLMPKKEVLHD